MKFRIIQSTGEFFEPTVDVDEATVRGVLEAIANANADQMVNIQFTGGRTNMVVVQKRHIVRVEVRS